MQYVSVGILIAISSFIFLLVRDWGQCSYTEVYATERVLKALSKSEDPKYLSGPSFIEEDCSYNYLYKDENSEISYVFTGWGEVHKWDHARDQ